MSLLKILDQIKAQPILPKEFSSGSFYVFDFSDRNEELASINMNDQREFENYINSKINENNSTFGIGKYAENRILYRRFNLFEKGDPRSFHLGLDIWQKAGTEIHAPLDGIVHSFQNNKSIGDYGPTIILEHAIDNFRFFTLYGHLSRESLIDKHVGKKIKAGEIFCSLGDWSENVNWPAHLHFQIIEDLMDKRGDFPGVCEFGEKEKWMLNCPDPNRLLKIEGL
ncbi:MAG: peptidoglycan DD-metalloendopeptidase family protein [Cytophagales bacterium]